MVALAVMRKGRRRRKGDSRRNERRREDVFPHLDLPKTNPANRIKENWEAGGSGQGGVAVDCFQLVAICGGAP
jgi:hypothetical protein